MLRKKPFLLLEVLVAFVLLTICLVPLVKQPLLLYKKERACLEEMEWERLADWTFTEVKELLLKNEIDWEKIPKPLKTSANFPLPPKTICLPGYDPKEIERHFQLYTYGEKQGLENQTYRQLKVTVFLKTKSYEFRLPIQRIME